MLVAKREDLARTLLTSAMESTAMMTVWTALAKNCGTVYVCGRIFEHALPRNHFSYCFAALGFMFGKVLNRVQLTVSNFTSETCIWLIYGGEVCPTPKMPKSLFFCAILNYAKKYSILC